MNKRFDGRPVRAVSGGVSDPCGERAAASVTDGAIVTTTDLLYFAQQQSDST